MIENKRLQIFYKISLLLIILLGGCSSRHSPAPVVHIQGFIPLKDRVKQSITSEQYKVKKGETLYSIAWRANSDVRELAEINDLSPPYQIFPGQNLFLLSKNKGKTAYTSPHKPLVKLSTKSSSQTSTKTPTKAIASSKKQAYGKNVSRRKVSKNNSLAKTPFSQKIRRWRWPVQGRVITGFSSASTGSVLQSNTGIDIAGKRGTKIKATAKGKVVYVGNVLTGYGKLIIIRHNDDYLSAYAHNDKILVKEQQLVNAGEVIAKMGDTDAQRVMLHFEVRFRGKSVNPMKYLPKR